MTPHSTDAVQAIAPTPVPAGDPASGDDRIDPVARLALFIRRSDSGTRAALARLNPDALLPHQATALVKALLSCDVSPEHMSPAAWRRWALVAHGMALSGHDARQGLGRQFAAAGVSEPRVARFLSARSDAFAQALPALLRMMASKAIQPNWFVLAPLILLADSDRPEDQDRCEALRLRTAGEYFAQVART